MKTEIERAPFEAWAKTEKARVNLTLASYPENHSTYKFSRTQHLFEGWLARESQAPVPPAGDVEVLGWVVSSPETKGFRASKTAYLQRPDWAYAEDNAERYAIHELVDLAEVTRLTAERDGLLKQVARKTDVYQVKRAELTEERAKNDALQSELTKARELLARISNNRNYPIGWATQDEVSTFLAHNADESCGQDAEAAKGERS